MDTQRRRCLGLFVLALALLSIAIGYLVVVDEPIGDYFVIVAGLFVAWIAFFYCASRLIDWT